MNCAQKPPGKLDRKCFTTSFSKATERRRQHRGSKQNDKDQRRRFSGFGHDVTKGVFGDVSTPPAPSNAGKKSNNRNGHKAKADPVRCRGDGLNAEVEIDEISQISNTETIDKIDG